MELPPVMGPSPPSGWDSLVGADPTVWLDYVRLAPAGNERVADLILGSIADEVREVSW